MKRQQLIVGLCGLLAVAAAVAAPKNPYILLANGKQMAVKSMKVYNGTGIEFVDANDRTIRWNADQFKAAYVPEPDQVAALEKLLEAKEYDKVIQFAGQTFSQYSILGWGDKIAYLEGTAYLEKKEPEKAAAAFAKGLPFPGSYRDNLARGRVLAMIAQGKVEEVRNDLDSMVRSSRKADAAMAFNARGQILANEGKSKEAVLEYLKTLLLFEADAKDVEPYRDEARKQVVALMRKMGDPKWRMFVDVE